MTPVSKARRTLASLAVAPLLVAGLAGCDDGPSTSARDETASTPVAAAALSRLSEGDRIDQEEFVGIIVDGVARSTTAQVEMQVKMSSRPAMTGSGEIDYTTAPPSLAATMQMPIFGEMSVVSVDGILYVSMADLGGGQYWKVDPTDPDGPLAGMGVGQVLDQADPIAAMKVLEPGIDKVVFRGVEDVDGRTLDHYELTIDPRVALESLGTDPSGFGSGDLPERVTYQVWLDEQDRFAQLDAELPIAGETVSMQMEMSHWGEDVHIEPPPADQVEEMPDLLGGMTPPA